MFFILCRPCSLLAHLETKYIIQECSEDCISVFIFHTQQTIENVANIQTLSAQIETQGVITWTKGLKLLCWKLKLSTVVMGEVLVVLCSVVLVSVVAGWYACSLM